MPQFTAKPFPVEAHQFQGMLSPLPLGFAERVSGRRNGDGHDVQTDDGVRVCRPSDWLVRDAGGRFEVLSDGVFSRRFAPVFVAEFTPAGITATFLGAPNGREEDQPPYVDGWGLRFWRHKPTPVSAPSTIEALKLNSHFVVNDPVDPPPHVRRGPGRPRKDPQLADAGPALAPLVASEGADP